MQQEIAVEYKSLQELGNEIRKINQANGWNITAKSDWNDVYKIPAIIALIHSEASEALEAFRNDDTENFKEEMADILIRVLDCIIAFDVDFDVTVCLKLEKNRNRAYRHGGKKV